MPLHVPKNRRMLRIYGIVVGLIIAGIFGAKFIADLRNKFTAPEADSVGQCKTFTAGGPCNPAGTPLECTKNSCPGGYKTWRCDSVTKKWVKVEASKCSGCPWTETNGKCCPRPPDACTTVGEKRCIPDPVIAECTPWLGADPSCQYKNYWKAVDWIDKCPAPTNTPKPKPSSTPIPTVTPIITQAPSPTPTRTPTPTKTPTPTRTPTPIKTPTPSPTLPPGVTPTITPIPTHTPGPTSTPGPGPTSTPEPTATPKPLAQANPTPGGQTLAQSGNIFPTLIVSAGGILLLILGIVFAL
jgi:hypothetical protein